ncbi:hypothetical protein BLNAU_22538 [Blattamonas nauphoetae]|uniref:Uncharacterized protein n=1 Tax=Blattamonas nauphoetae TaxID=2049346 RepID=A0ABQ9WVU5_9EUKA|nr:hypothetical protein BLNAU_22538 [Blattamonas nauphoetae]
MDLIASFYGMFRSLWPFNRDRTPLFLRINPRTYRTIEQLSPAYLSLVYFIKGGNKLGFIATNQACALLKQINPKFRARITFNNLLFELVPTPDGSCSGFADSLLLFLASTNTKLVQSTLSLLVDLMFFVEPTHVPLLETGFFALLPQSFYEQEVHLSSKHDLYLMQIVRGFVDLSDPNLSEDICRANHISMDSFHQTFIDKFFHPIQPFLEYACRNRRTIYKNGHHNRFQSLLESILTLSPSLEEMTQFVLSSSIPIAYTDYLHLVEHISQIHQFYETLASITARWDRSEDRPRRRQQIAVKLREEGVSDEIELNIRSSLYDFYEDRVVFFGARLLHKLGANAPFLETRED